MSITRADFNDLIKNAKVQWKKAADEFPSVRNQIAVVASVDEATSEHSSISGLPTARRRSDGGEAYKGEPKQGFTKTFNQQEVAIEIDVTKQMRKFDKYNEIMSRIRNSSRSAQRRLELDVASLLSYAWSTSYTNLDGETVTTSVPDGLALINAAHTVNGASGTFANQLSGTHDPISPSTLESLEELFNNFLDDDGRNIPVMPDTIISGRHAPTVHEIKRIMNSELLAGTSDNDKNTFKNSYNHIIVPFLDLNADESRDSGKSRYVFLAALNDRDMNGFRVEMSQDAKLEAPDQVTETGIWQFVTTALYDFGTLRANFIAGTKGNGSAV